MKPKLLGLVILISVFLITIDTFAAQYTFIPRVSATETYSDNIDRTGKNKEDDFTTRVSAGGTFSILGKTSGMDLSFDQSYVWYHSRTEDDAWRLPLT